ncbi:hypothetical protein, partial [Aeromonas salmonicida]|uniref:hypothetical protein n=1 Tax=Aeromonas salmonicida TaxID=645 RepID=UPI003D310BD7
LRYVVYYPMFIIALTAIWSSAASDMYKKQAPGGVQSLSVGGINLVSGGVVASVSQRVTTGLGNTHTLSPIYN